MIYADEIVDILKDYYGAREYLCYPELRIGTGYGKNAEQRIDFWALDPMPANKFRRVACEIKVSRGDWLRELKQPLKRRQALLLSNEFYIVAPVGIVKADELPIEAGLIEITDPITGEGWPPRRPSHRLNIKHIAPFRDGYPPNWRFVAGLLRRDLRECAAALVENEVLQ